MLPATSFSNLKLVKLSESAIEHEKIFFHPADKYQDWYTAMVVDGSYHVDTGCDLRFATMIQPDQVEEEQDVPDLNRFIYLRLELVPGLPPASSFATLAIILTQLANQSRPLIDDLALNNLMYATIHDMASMSGRVLRSTLLSSPGRKESLYVDHDFIVMLVDDRIQHARRTLRQQGHVLDEEE